MALLYHNNNSISNVTSFAQIPAGDMKLLSTATASSSASIEFNSTYINSDYKIYKFEFINMHPQTDSVFFQFNFSTDNGSNYNVVKTTTSFEAYHNESDSATNLRYATANDLAQSTSYQRLTELIPSSAGEDDMCVSGNLQLFNPSSSTYVKHFLSSVQANIDGSSNYSWISHNAGYANTVSPLTNIRFSMSSGNIDAGQIKLYGIGAN